MIGCVGEFVEAVTLELATWQEQSGPVSPWFRGESDNDREEDRDPPLCPKIARYSAEEENHLLQTFRRKAGGIANTPPRDHTDLWLFLAQHYGLPTRLLDWTEGALIGLYFAISRRRPNPRVYMLDPHKLNALALGCPVDRLNYPLTWADKPGYENIALAWEFRKPSRGYALPIAVPATYEDHRMIAQRSCFTVHGQTLAPLDRLLRNKGVQLTDCLIQYPVDPAMMDSLQIELAVFGVTGSTIFPDLDHVARDIANEVGQRERRAETDSLAHHCPLLQTRSSAEDSAQQLGAMRRAAAGALPSLRRAREIWKDEPTILQAIHDAIKKIEEDLQEPHAPSS